MKFCQLQRQSGILIIFEPGLVGGECIGVDPYYLVHLAEMNGYYPRFLKESRMVNESMPKYVVEKFNVMVLKEQNRLIKS